MKALLMTLTFATALGFAHAADSTSNVARGISLPEALAIFNKHSLSDPIGADQSPITEREVIAAILLWERPTDAPVSDELLGSFKSIAKSRTLPSNASFERLNGYDRGGMHVFDVWSVRITIERADGSSYSFVIRERAIGSRTLGEELARLDQYIEEQDVAKWVGGYRIVERRNELEARIKANAR